MDLEHFLLKYEIDKIDSSMKLRAIFRNQYYEFDEIRNRGNLYKLPYSKIIQDYLTEHNVLQTNGEPISLEHIRNEMAAVGREVAKGFKPKKSNLKTNTPQYDSSAETKNQSGQLNIDFINEKNVIEGEFANYQSADKKPLVWTTLNQDLLIHYDSIAKNENLTINLLELKHFTNEVEFGFFKVWLRKAKFMKKLNS